MAYGRITKKQTEILEYIKTQILNKGYPPSVRDICQDGAFIVNIAVHAGIVIVRVSGDVLNFFLA